jgi:hypothetical protein
MDQYGWTTGVAAGSLEKGPCHANMNITRISLC